MPGRPAAGRLTGALAEINCTALSDPANDAQYPAVTVTSDGTPVTGTCNAGYAGAPTRTCSSNNTWGAPAGTPCTRTSRGAVAGAADGAAAAISCPATSSNNAQWLSAQAGTANVVGVCDAGYTNPPTRTCNITGVWLTPSGSCSLQSCAGFTSSDGGTVVPSAGAGTTASGSCSAGWQFGAAGVQPSIACPLVSPPSYTPSSLANPCVRTWARSHRGRPLGG